MNVATQLLLVEDDGDIRGFVRGVLEQEGFGVCEAANAQQGAIEAGTRKPDLLILDLGLPDRDGVDLIRDLRGWTRVPILVLSARVDESDKVEALNAGADDYLTKPFGAGELIARVRAILRRGASDAGRDLPVCQFGRVRVDMANHTVTRDGVPVHLTPVEFRLLGRLVARAGRMITHRQLLSEVWGPAHLHDSHYLRIYMGHLRRKLEADPARPRHFLTETGVGYRFVP